MNARGTELKRIRHRTAKRAVWIASIVCAPALLLTPSPAAANGRTATDLTGVTLSCGDTQLTFTSGVQVGDLHRVVLGNGEQIVINDVVLHGGALTDDAGNSYRAVGGANSTAHVRFEGVEDSWGHFNVHIVVLGDHGKVGKLMLRERTSRDGTITQVTGGGCSF